LAKSIAQMQEDLETLRARVGELEAEQNTATNAARSA